MVVTLRNNKKLLPNRRRYFKPSNYVTLKKEYYKTGGNEFNVKKATPEQLKKIRTNVIRKRKNEVQKFGLSFFIALPLICFGLYKGFSNLNFGFPKMETETTQANIEKSKEQQYMFYIEDGDNWISKRNYFNAVFQYKKALDRFPHDFEANYRLALAYSYRCQYNFEDCGVGMELTLKLEKQFPDNKKIKDIKAVFIHWGE